MRLQDLPDALFEHILSFLPRGVTAYAACAVDCRWARTCDDALRLLCEKRAWKQPRSRRLAAASATGGGDALRWRALYVSRACPACLDAPGDFAARRSKHEAPLYLLCGACCRRESVIDKMRAAGATLDVTGVSGKPLYTQRGDRFVSEVAAAARRAGLG